MSGSYDPGSRSGQIRAVFVNESAGPIAARALVAITEDSIYYPGTNGDNWHNHVGRDYVPDENGTEVVIPARGRDTLIQSFTLATGWNEQRCNVLVCLQEPSVRPDSSRPVYQAALSPVLQLSGMEERPPVRPVPSELSVWPNPCTGILRLSVPGAGGRARLVISDAGGRPVRSFDSAPGSSELDLRDLPEGVYFVARDRAGSARVKVILAR